MPKKSSVIDRAIASLEQQIEVRMQAIIALRSARSDQDERKPSKKSRGVTAPATEVRQ